MRKQTSILVFNRRSISSGCARQLGTVPLVSHQPKQVHNINIVNYVIHQNVILILILYINIVYVTFIEGGTAVFPCMASAFGISYSPDCKQSLGSLHWTYATKKIICTLKQQMTIHPIQECFGNRRLHKRHQKYFFWLPSTPS